tara:strand:- start:353 stop:712 length:360 start_codon:yes stop_codon:yes gene_type:complete
MGNNPIIDRGYKGLARAKYKTIKSLRSALRDRGIEDRLEKYNGGRYYRVSSSSEGGISLVFEKKDDVWQITRENWKRLFNVDGVKPEEYLDDMIGQVRRRKIVDPEVVEYHLMRLKDLM